MAKAVKVYDKEKLLEEIESLEKEGYKHFNFLHDSEIVNKVNPDLPEDHAHKKYTATQMVIWVFATGKSKSKTKK